MEIYLVEIALCIILGLVFLFASPVLLFAGKHVLKVLTLNKYPPHDPTPKQEQYIIDAGFVFFFIIIIVIFFIRNN